VSQTLSVLLDDELLSLNRAVGVIRRRNLAIESLTVGPGMRPGIARLTVMLETDEGSLQRMLNQLRKTVGVRQAVSYGGERGVARELALIKVRVRHERYAEMLDAISLFKAALVDEGPDEVIVQVAGSEAFILALVRALEPFGIVDIARSGSIALERSAAVVPTPLEDAIP
jgi:acetolactate synthase-1/3 small subunit